MITFPVKAYLCWQEKCESRIADYINFGNALIFWWCVYKPTDFYLFIWLLGGSDWYQSATLCAFVVEVVAIVIVRHYLTSAKCTDIRGIAAFLLWPGGHSSYRNGKGRIVWERRESENVSCITLNMNNKPIVDYWIGILVVIVCVLFVCLWVIVL